jgi:tetratricopeptide (TPR) repeat protein
MVNRRVLGTAMVLLLLLLAGVIPNLNAFAQKANNTTASAQKKSEFDFLRYATTNGDVDLLLNTAISLEQEKRFEKALKFAEAAGKAVPQSKSAEFLVARIKSKQLLAQGKTEQAKKIFFNVLKSSKVGGSTNTSAAAKWDVSDMYAQPAGAADRMLKTFMKNHPRNPETPVSLILWQSAGAPASFYSDESQYFELSAKPPRLAVAFVLGKEAYVLGVKKSAAVRTIFGRIALKYVRELKQQGKSKDAAAAAREFLSTGCGYNRPELKKFAIQ